MESARARTIAGKYELEKLLGQGGMGEVWVAKELSTGRELALKLLKTAAADSKENRARFEREARIATTLVSPHIVQVTDSGVDDDGDPFMAMELLHGEDLQQRIKAEKRLALAQVVRLAIQVGRGLHVAHTAGLVHRDLKPANIFIARQGDEEIFKVLDFGIAKAESTDSSEYTAAGAMLGTASYMSPEQIRSAKTVDHRADLWAFAVVLFRSLTGQFPFSETGFELFLALMSDPIPVPAKVTSLVPELPAPLNVFFERSFVRDLSQRYATASAAVVGFCRAAGVTVPSDVLHAAGAPMPGASVSAGSSRISTVGPVSGTFAAPPRPPTTPPSSGPAAAPVSSPPFSSPSAYGGSNHDQASPLSGTLMLDNFPSPSDRASGPLPAAGRAAEPDLALVESDTGELASTLFYQPGLQVPPAGPPESKGTPSTGLSGGPAKPFVFTYPLDAARAAAGLSSEGASPATSQLQLSQAAPAAQLAQPNQGQPPVAYSGRSSHIWLGVMIGLLLAVAGGAWFFLRVP